jgi:predicted HNH restriction endonuclease
VATDVHHKKGRGKYHLDTSTWLPVCRNCHEWIETHPEDAKELGYSETRI